MNAVIVSVGTELVVGQCVDTNSAWLSTELTSYGVHVRSHITVGDEVDRIEAAIRTAIADADLVIVTGGLGPTADDLTRQALAAAISEPLEENRDALTQIQAFFDRWKRPMPESNRLQALVPRGGRVLENRRGTAPGIGIERNERFVFALPGVPAEMKVMFDEWIRPLVAERSDGATACEIRLLCFGISEAKVGDAIADLMARGRNPMVGTTAADAILSVRIVAYGQDESQAQAMADRDAAEVRRRLGSVVFGEGNDTLEQVVGRLLVDRGLTISVAESCTGGMLAAGLTDVPGSSTYFRRGYVTYSNEAKVELLGVPPELIEHPGAVSETAARAMATGCRRVSQTDWAVAITGIAGPSGGSPPDKPVGLVFVGLADRQSVEVKRFLFGEHLTRQEIRDRACKSALDMLRMRLLGVKRGE